MIAQGTPSDRATLALAGFGIRPSNPARAHRELVERAETAAKQIVSVTTRRVVFITGPSGAGKTTLLDAIARAAPVSRVRQPDRLTSPRCLIDWVHPSPSRSMKALASCGLADARVFLTPVRTLSTGQRSRASLARALACTTRQILICDEFCSGLDALTAEAVARTSTRAVKRAGRTLLAVSTDERLIDPLGPDTLVYVSLAGEIEIHSHSRSVR